MGYLTEYEDWRLLLVAREFDKHSPTDAYGMVHAVLKPAGFTAFTRPTLLILPPTDPFVKGLCKAYRKFGPSEGLRLRGQLFGDRFIEDAYVYRIT